MSDNGASHFYADKPNRNAAFHYPNILGNQDPPEENGDQGARVHPIPAVLGTRQKTQGDVTGEAGYESSDAEQSGRQPGDLKGDAVNNR